MVYLHALRRHRRMVTFAGLLCAAAAAVTAWLLSGPKYEAVASVQIAMTDPRVMFNVSDVQMQAALQNAFEIYRDTQLAILKDRWLLQAALRSQTWEAQSGAANDRFAAAEALDAEQRAKLAAFNDTWKLRAVDRLKDTVRVGFPLKNGEVMQVSVVGKDAVESAALVNAVVRAYYSRVVGDERAKRRHRASQLDGIYFEKKQEMQNCVSQLKATADQLGTSDSDTLSVKQQNAAQLAAEYQREAVRLRFEKDRTEGLLASTKKQLADLAETEIPEYEVLAFVMNDPMVRQYHEQLMYMQMVRDQNQRASKGGVNTGFLIKNQTDVNIVETQLEQFYKKMGEKVRAMKRAEMEKDRRKYEAEAEVLKQQVEEFQKDVDKQVKAAEQLGKKQVDVEMQKADLRHLNETFANVANERDRLRVELNSDPRVQILGDKDCYSRPALVPLTQSGVTTRIALTILAALAGFGVPAVGIVLWDLQAGRINAAGEVSKGLGLPVIGSLPLIPARVIRQLGLPTPRNQMWRMRLTESVDALTARLLRKAELEQSRVVLVTSALGGEGKTTLATQLAMSLARSSRRTVLVDFDLRRPALDGVFGLPLEPGVCETLRGHGEISRMVHPTTTEHLSVLTAGRWDRQILAALANGAAGPLLDQLRANFDFVIIDSSPILPVADTRFVSQKVDAAILSVKRDVSRGGEVVAACEILEAFGVRTVEAVVTGGYGPAYGRAGEYEPAELAATEPLATGGPEDSAPQTPDHV